MEYLRLIESDLNVLGAESRKRHPEVFEEVERALASLRIIREQYVSELRRRDDGSKSPKLTASSDLVSPYIFACNYVDGNSKMLNTALNGFHMLLSHGIVPLCDIDNILRVLSIQGGNADLHLKIVQVLMVVVNLFATEQEAVKFMTDLTLFNLLSLCLQLADSNSKSVSVTSTALGTVTQMIHIVFQQCDKLDEKDSPLLKSTAMLLKDIISFADNKSGEWIRGNSIPQINSLEIIFDVLQRHPLIFHRKVFSDVFRLQLIPMLKIQLKNVQESFMSSIPKIGIANATISLSRVMRITKLILIDYMDESIAEDCDFIITMLLHNLQSENVNSSIPSSVMEDKLEESPMSLFTVGGAGAFISKLNISGMQMNSSQSVKVASTSQQSYFLSVQHSNQAKKGSSFTNTSSPLKHVPIHPAISCIEVLISFYLSDLSRHIANPQMIAYLISFTDNIVTSAALLITNALAVESNVEQDYENILKESQLINSMEDILCGNEVDVDFVLRSLDEVVVSSSNINAIEVIVFAFELLQVCVRILLKFSLQVAALKATESQTPTVILNSLSRSTITDIVSLPSTSDSTQLAVVSDCIQLFVSKVSEECYENIRDTCLAVLADVDSSIVASRSFGVLSELTISCGLSGLTKPCNNILTSMCKLTVPVWHGQDILATSPENSFVSKEDEILSSRHIEVVIRLVQTIHILSDVISDWDTIIDAFEQVLMIINTARLSNDTSLVKQIDSLHQCLNRFKSFSVFLSQDSLMKLMSSLIALSLNCLGSTDGASMSSHYSNIVDTSKPAYIVSAIQAGVMSYPLNAVIEITKINCHRVSCVWQMVTSHIRMIATHKSIKLRSLAVSAIFDMITSTLKTMQSGYSNLMSDSDFLDYDNLPKHIACRSSSSLSDNIIFNWICPTFETVFFPRKFHREILLSRNQKESEDLVALEHRLSSNDLLSCLRGISTVQHEDVRVNIISSLLETLQNDGHLFAGSWSSVLDIIMIAPMSVEKAIDIQSLKFRESKLHKVKSDKFEEDKSDSIRWSKSSLLTSFNCIEVIVDEFQELLQLTDVKAAIACLGAFSAQNVDVNISLTSMEMMWKTADLFSSSCRSKGDDANAEITLGVLMDLLSQLSMDPRPEIRHCAMNTLFGAIVVNASTLSSTKWKEVFENILRPIYDQAGERSALAMSIQEEAMAPELKKGVKMTVHHSRDTAHKQWTETQVLALKGVARVLKSCARHLLLVDWFESSWISIIGICRASLHLDVIETEVSLAGLECLFTMLKFVSLSSEVVSVPKELEMSQAKFTKLETARESLWTKCWKGLIEAVYVDMSSIDVALKFCQSLQLYYQTNLTHEFRYSENLRSLLTMIIVISRPRSFASRIPIASMNEKFSQQQQRSAELQLRRLILDMVKSINTSFSANFGPSSMVITLSEICFSNQRVSIGGTFADRNIKLGPIPSKLRVEAAELLLELMNNSLEEKTSKSLNKFRSVEIIVKQFVECIFASAIDKRFQIVDIDNNHPTQVENHIETPIKPYSNIFSATFGRLLSSKESAESKNSTPDKGYHDAMHVFESPFNSTNSIGLKLSTCISDAKEDAIWLPCHCQSELEVIKNALSSVLDHVANEQDLKKLSWNCVNHMIACMICPWKSSEIQLHENDEVVRLIETDSVISSSNLICSIVKGVFSKVEQVNFHIDFAIPLIHSIVTSNKICFHAVFETWKDDKEVDFSKHRVYFAKFYEQIWEVGKSFLVSILNSPVAPFNVKYHSLRGLLSLCNELTLHSMTVANQNFDMESSFHPIFSACESHFQSLLELSSVISIHQSFDSMETSEKELFLKWCYIFSKSQKTPQSPMEIESTDMIIDPHKLVLLSMSIKLLCSLDGLNFHQLRTIKSMLKKVITSIDISGLPMILAKLTEESKSFKIENESLKAEVSL